MPEPSPPASPTVTLADIRVAREQIAGRVHRTPILTSATAARIAAAAGTPLADDRLYLKAEHLQVTGSFKPRGMLWRVSTLDEHQRAAGIITVSAGNAGQGYAWAAKAAGVHAVVVMPVNAVQSKVDACRGYGAEVVQHGEHFGETAARMAEIAAERDLFIAHPFDDPAVVAGHGSVGLEILEDLPEVDVVVVAIGGGGLIAGAAIAIKEQRPGTRIYGVEPEISDAMNRAFEAGRIIELEPRSVADGLNAPFAGEVTYPLCRRYLDGIVLLDEATILAGLRFAIERAKQVLEPAGAAALAAVLFGRIPIRPGERVLVVASGGNVDGGKLGELIAAAAPLPG